MKLRLEGYIEKIIYRNEENGYTVLSVVIDEKHDDTQVFVGYVEGAEQGLYITAEGEEVEHPYYESQFKIQSYEFRMPDDLDSMERYLSSGAIKGIGPVLALHIVKKFKKDTFRIIEFEPERLAEIKGISERKAREIGIQFHESQDIRQAMMFLGKYGINAHLAVKIYNEYGNRMYKVLEENPYQLAEDIQGVGFKIADEIARRAGIGLDSEFRVRSAILYTLNQSGTLGHMFLPKAMLVRKVASFLVPEGGDVFEYSYEEVIEQQLMELQLERKIILKEIEGVTAVYGGMQYHKELDTARMLLDLDLTYDIPNIEIENTLKRIEEKSEIELDQLQRNAVRQAATSGLVIITGGPGTGKTTVINTIIQYFEQEGMELRLAAPTGRAAKRMTEATGYQAQTIHRLLELSGGVEGDAGFRFDRNAQNPLEADVVIIDEMSMVDIYLAHALLQAIIPGTHLIMVGDVNQLPSVGPGNVLKDIINSKEFPVIELSTVYRQEENSDIVMNAHRINRGEYPVMDNQSKDFFLLPRNQIRAIIEEVGKLTSVKMPKYVQAKPYEVQVLTPMRQGELGVENLNRELQAILNPASPKKKEHTVRNITFREGDKVMQIKNNYKLEWAIYDKSGYFELDKGVGVFNGDIGIVQTVDDYAEELKVLMDDDKVVTYDFKMLDELELAYAITIHKSQGSEYPAVILPILNGPRVLLHRNLLYTAITRAKKCVVIVGNGYKVHEMVDNVDEQKRYSGLCWAIRELVQKGEMVE
ncbi:MAG: ATP-dependent RecD-like DNA helicase [Lachnospiraceae bacterium]|nr:ATP-dependent RecD-like DNA helicase [Lachnospiraceae bacterium]